MKKVILFQGDSITDAARSRDSDEYPGHGYPTLVKAEIGCDAPGAYIFHNRGISGNRVVDLYARIKADIINLKPDYLSILIGVNDVWHEIDWHNGVEAEKFERVYDMLITEIKEALPNIKIMLLEPFVLNAGATCNDEAHPTRWSFFKEEVALRAAATRRLSEKHGLPFIALQEKFDALCEKEEAAYWLMDGVHPTSMGHEVIARAWVKAFREIEE